MALSARLEIRQGQGLVITPQLQQAIKLLQLSNLELDAFVDAELERNPLLARDERDAEPEAEAPIETAADLSTDRIADADARAELDTSHDEASPGERVTGDAQNDMGAAEAGASIDWSKASRGGSFDNDGEGPCKIGAGLTNRFPSHRYASQQVSGQAAGVGDWLWRSARD